MQKSAPRALHTPTPAFGVATTRAQRTAFSLALTCGSRAIQLRDRLMGRIPSRSADYAGVACRSLTIASGRNVLDASFVEPSVPPARASVLICHGIGEIVRQWLPIQHLLGRRGVASLVFDYSGYGRSSGWPRPAQFELDAISAFAQMRSLTPSVSRGVLGFSLGSGIASAVLNQIGADCLVLCSGFTSFRAAACHAGIPRFLSSLVPPIWAAESALRACRTPVLIVHSTHDRLFPVAMARELASWCGPNARSIRVTNLAHNEPFYKPTPAYWDPIADFLARPAAGPA